MTSFKLTICPSVTIRDGGSKALDGPGSAEGVAVLCAAAALLAAAAAAFAAKLLPVPIFAAVSVPEAFAVVAPAERHQDMTPI